MFILKVIKIFFRNKYKEIKYHCKYVLPTWSEFGYICLFFLILAVLGAGIVTLAYGLGYCVVNVFHLTLPPDKTADTGSYIGLGFALSIVMTFIGYIVYKFGVFLRWIWSNIKIAIAEAKEI